MKCKVCGAIINDPMAEYCSNCGHNLLENGLLDIGSDADNQNQPQNTLEQKEPQVPPQPMGKYWEAPQPQAPPQQIPPEKKNSSGAKWIVLTSVIAVLLVSVGVGVFLYFDHSKTTAIDQFKIKVSGFEGIKSQYELGKFETEYENVIGRCNECIEEKNVNVIDVLEEQMEDVKNNVIDNNNEEIDKCKEEIQTLKNEYIKENERLQVENSIKQADALMAEQKYKDAYEYYEKALEVLREQKQGSASAASEDTDVANGTQADAAQSAWSTQNEYYFWDSDTRYLTTSELSSLSEEQLRLARNEIYARHGRRFESDDIQRYFDSLSWYHGTIEPKDFDDDSLNKVESANVKKIQDAEKALKGENKTNSSTEKIYGFYIYDSDIRYLTKDELSVYNAEELRIIRNEIYARHGRKFTSKDLQKYFNGCDWYDGCIEAKDFDDEMILSELERANIKLIQKVEKEKK
ncbi:MAG: YARHG domain-containing protein [bacterium]|nr:YARHG domain-containing protein [bacterium]